jgi:uncharacterized phage infection (PIP) family protein YhgE
LVYRLSMDQSRSLKIASLKVELGLLQKDEQRFQSIISLPLTAPELRVQAQASLSSTLEKIKRTVAEINRLGEL